MLRPPRMCRRRNSSSSTADASDVDRLPPRRARGEQTDGTTRVTTDRTAPQAAVPPPAEGSPQGSSTPGSVPDPRGGFRLPADAGPGNARHGAAGPLVTGAAGCPAEAAAEELT